MSATAIGGKDGCNRFQYCHRIVELEPRRGRAAERAHVGFGEQPAVRDGLALDAVPAVLGEQSRTQCRERGVLVRVTRRDVCDLYPPVPWQTARTDARHERDAVLAGGLQLLIGPQTHAETLPGAGEVSITRDVRNAL